MKLIDSIIRNERGTVLVVALMILVILTIIGIVAVTTSTRDIQIAGYDVLYKQAFYNADAGISYLVGRSPSTSALSTGETIVSMNNFDLIYLGTIPGSPAVPRQIVVQSNGQDKNGKASVSIIAGYQYPSEGKGALPGPGYEGAY